MKTIMLAWEFGGGSGHISRLELIAQALRKLNYRIIFVVKDLQTASNWLSAKGYRFIQAPTLHGQYINFPPRNFAEILMAEGYSSFAALHGIVEGWVALIQLIRPVFIVADYAPTAIIAGKIVGVSVLHLATGFELPPRQSPFPIFRAEDSSEAGAVVENERSVLANLNRVLNLYRYPKLHSLYELFDQSIQMMATIPELDHYGERREALYIGPMFSDHGERSVAWKTTKHKIICYVSLATPGLIRLVEALSYISAEVLIVVPSWPENSPTFANVTIHGKLLDLSELIPSADLVVSNAGLGLSSRSLLCGVPLALLPLNTEQSMIAASIERLGAGLIIDLQNKIENITRQLNFVLRNSDMSLTAARVKEKHQNCTVQNSVAEVMRVLHFG